MNDPTSIQVEIDGQAPRLPVRTPQESPALKRAIENAARLSAEKNAQPSKFLASFY